MESLTDDYYEFIGIGREATDSEIKQACHKLLLKYHPDRCKAPYADRITQYICEIKAVLLDVEKRKVYDKTLSALKQDYPVREVRKPEAKPQKTELKRNTASLCDWCGEDDTMPFTCHRCGGRFCSNHRLPEEHQCKNAPSYKPDEKPQSRARVRPKRTWVYAMSDIQKRIASGEGTLDDYICPLCIKVRDIDRYMCEYCKNERSLKCDWCGKHFCKQCIEPYRHNCIDYSRERFKQDSKKQYREVNSVVKEDEMEEIQVKVPFWKKIFGIK